MPSKDDDNKNDNENENENGNENENDNENGNENEIKQLNYSLDKIIDKTKSFEDQVKSLKKVKNLGECWHKIDYGDKKLKFKIFKLKFPHLSNIIDEKLFEQIFGHTFQTLANKLINITNKEENQIIVNDIDKNKKQLFEKDKYDIDYVIKPSD